MSTLFIPKVCIFFVIAYFWDKQEIFFWCRFGNLKILVGFIWQYFPCNRGVYPLWVSLTKVKKSQKRGKMHSAHNTVELQVQLPHVDIMSRWHCCPERVMVSQSDWVSMGRLSLHLCLKCFLHAQVLEAWPPVLGHLYWGEGLWRWLAPEGLTSGVCCPIHRPTALETIGEPRDVMEEVLLETTDH